MLLRNRTLSGHSVPSHHGGSGCHPHSRLLGVSLSLSAREGGGTSQMLNHPPPLNNHILVQSLPHFTKVPWRMRWEDNLPLLRLASSPLSPLGHYLWEKPDTVSQGHSREPWGQAQVARSWVRPLLNSCGEWRPAHISRWSDAQMTDMSGITDTTH